MIITNSFRFGEISRKQAGRFTEEGYQQGSFQFKNARTMFDNGMARRFPLRTDVAFPILEEGTTTYIYTIYGITIKDDESYVVAIGVEKDGDRYLNNIVIVYEVTVDVHGKTYFSPKILRDSGNNHMFRDRANYTSEYANVELDKTICRGIRFAQYYDRLYIVSHKFAVCFIDFTTMSIRSADFKFNQDAKDKLYYIKSSERETDTIDGRLVFKSGNGYFDDIELTKPSKITENGVDRLVTDADVSKVTNKYVAGFEDYEADYDLNTITGTYPSVVAIIGESLFFANTIQNPSTIWKSRTIGTSQWFTGYGSDTMHDFCQFDVVSTEEDKIRDKSEWTTVDSGYFETTNGIDNWFIRGNNYTTRLEREPKFWVINGNDKLFYTNSGNIYTKYEFLSNEARPKLVDGEYCTGTGTGKVIYTAVNATEPLGADPFKNVDPATGTRYYSVNDFNWYRLNADGERYKEFDGRWAMYYPEQGNLSTYPVKKPIKNYDLSDASNLVKREVTIDFVATASCGMRFELNTGMNDSVKFIACGCDKIIVGTSNAEWKLPTNFNVENTNSENYSSYGALGVEPITMNRSFYFVQRGSLVRELYLNQSYMLSAEVTAFNHDIINSQIVDSIGKNTPDPTMYFVLENGNIIHIMYDRDGGLNSIAEWYAGDGIDKPFSFESIAVSNVNETPTVFTLVSNETGSYICEFDETLGESDDDRFYDEVGDEQYDFETKIETVFAESNNQEVVFGKFKKAKGVHLRPYKCGHIHIGNDWRQLNKTNYRLGSEDYYSPITGKSNKQFSMFLKSEGREPMNILAMAWEIDNGN